MPRFLPVGLGRRTWNGVLAHPAWTGVGALLGAFALVVTLLSSPAPSTAKTDPGPTDAAPRSTFAAPETEREDQPAGGNTVGDCSAQGDGNVINCDILEQSESIAEVDFTIDYGHGTWFFDGPPSELPTPPDYAVSDVYWHCETWMDWLTTTPGIYAMGPGGLIRMTGGANDIVAITDVRVQPYARDVVPTDDFTIIRCNHGGDAGPGLVIETDSATGVTTVRNVNGNGPPMEMPPAVAKVSENDLQLAAVVVTSGDYLYEGSLVAEVNINGEPKTIALGNPETPYRWLGGESRTTLDTEGAWDWNPVEQKWVEGMTPDDVTEAAD